MTSNEGDVPSNELLDKVRGDLAGSVIRKTKREVDLPENSDIRFVATSFAPTPGTLNGSTLTVGEVCSSGELLILATPIEGSEQLMTKRMRKGAEDVIRLTEAFRGALDEIRLSNAKQAQIIDRIEARTKQLEDSEKKRVEWRQKQEILDKVSSLQADLTTVRQSYEQELSIAAREMAIQLNALRLRVLLDQARQRILDPIDRPLATWAEIRQPHPNRDSLLDYIRSQLPEDQFLSTPSGLLMLSFLDTDNSIRRVGNSATHTASAEEIRVAIDAQPLGSTERGNLNVVFDFVFS
ncbi:unnamed protein product [Cyclocybe aegerita]|uniref:Uncharacterized protein n=1 Tax=Cyclocybe aegerita TaxID=1973307 RepID=A0A8S0VZI5_CYCAE|nr:unnamed protein product [Cyclocybe aegerita]